MVPFPSSSSISFFKLERFNFFLQASNQQFLHCFLPLTQFSIPVMNTSCSSQENLKTQQTLVRPSIRGQNFDAKPLWNHVKILGTAIGGRVNRSWSCNYCSNKVTRSYTKVKAHLLKLFNHRVQLCKAIIDDILREITKEHEQAQWKKS